MRDAKKRLKDILEAIEAIERYAEQDKASFQQDELLQTWFLYHLQIIGEATRSLPDEVRALKPSIPWSKIVGMRNILVHGYFDIDTELVWEAVTRDVPALKTPVEELLRSLERRDQ